MVGTLGIELGLTVGIFVGGNVGETLNAQQTVLVGFAGGQEFDCHGIEDIDIGQALVQ